MLEAARKKKLYAEAQLYEWQQIFWKKWKQEDNRATLKYKKKLKTKVKFSILQRYFSKVKVN